MTCRTLAILLLLSAPAHLAATDAASAAGATAPTGATVPAAAAEAAILERITTELDFPSNLAVAPGNRERLYVLEHAIGQILIIEGDQLQPEPFLDLGEVIDRSDEEGLLSLAFAPDYPSEPHAYVSYTNRSDELILSRFRVAPDGWTADRAS